MEKGIKVLVSSDLQRCFRIKIIIMQNDFLDGISCKREAILFLFGDISQRQNLFFIKFVIEFR